MEANAQTIRYAYQCCYERILNACRTTIKGLRKQVDTNLLVCTKNLLSSTQVWTRAKCMTYMLFFSEMIKNAIFQPVVPEKATRSPNVRMRAVCHRQLPTYASVLSRGNILIP